MKIGEEKMTDYKGDKLERLTGDERLGMHRESEYLGAEDIKPGTKPVLTIEGIFYGKVTLQRGKESKDVMTFVEKTVDGICEVRPLIVNSTNRKTLKKLYGAVDARTLEGKKVELYVDHNVRDPQTGGTTDGIRISPSVPKAAEYICENCGNRIEGAGKLNARDVALNTQKKFGRMLCGPCWKAANEAEKARELENREDVLNENNENQD